MFAPLPRKIWKRKKEKNSLEEDEGIVSKKKGERKNL